jgi:hypothetical protein
LSGVQLSLDIILNGLVQSRLTNQAPGKHVQNIKNSHDKLVTQGNFSEASHTRLILRADPPRAS